MTAVQFTFTRIGSAAEGRENAALLLDDGYGRPEVILLPIETLTALRQLAVDPALLTPAKTTADTAYGERLCELLVRSPTMSRVYAYLLPHLGGADRSLQLLFDVQDGLQELDGISWELLAGLQRSISFDALEMFDPERCIARVVRCPSYSQSKLPQLPLEQIEVLIWTPLRDDPITRSTAEALFNRLNRMGDLLKPVAAPTHDLARLAQHVRDAGRCAILHIITHGEQDLHGDVRVLTDTGSRDALGLELQLRPLAASLREGRILGAVLDICHGGGGRRPETSPGRRLVTAGFPFAIASETPLLTAAVESWSSEFYRSIANGASLYSAVTSARSATAGGDLDALDRFAWARQRLFLGSALVRSSGGLLQRPLLGVGIRDSKGGSTGTQLEGRFRLREQLLPRQRSALATLEFAVSSLLEDLLFDSVRFGDEHLGRVERTVDDLVDGLRLAGNPLRREEAVVLLFLIQLYSLGWIDAPAQQTPEGAARALLDAMDEASAGTEGGGAELVRLLVSLRTEVDELRNSWGHIKSTLQALIGSLRDTTRPFEPPPPVVRPLLLAALLRVADALDAGIHRIDEFKPTDDRPPTIERWKHIYSRRGAIRDGAIRFAFHIPQQTLLPVVNLAVAASMWADRHGALDNLVQAGLAVCVLPPSVEVQTAAQALRNVAGELSSPHGLVEALAAQLCASQSPRLRLVGSSEPGRQDPFAAFACSGVDAVENALKLPMPPERQDGGSIVFQIVGEKGEPVLPAQTIELEPGGHLELDCGALAVPVLRPLRFTLAVPRKLRSPITYEGIFWTLSQPVRRRCQQQLARFDGCADPLERTLAQASILRSYGCWSTALLMLVEAANQIKDNKNRLPLFAAMTGIYDRMLVVLSQVGGTEAIAARVRSHQESVWNVYYKELGVHASDHAEAALRTASMLVQSAGLQPAAPSAKGVSS